MFSKLQQGVKENEQLLTITRIRAEAEDAYAAKLFQIRPESNRIEGGFQKDDGASAKNVSVAILNMRLHLGCMYSVPDQ